MAEVHPVDVSELAPVHVEKLKVSDEPAVEMSCASQSNEKSRRRKTANIDGAGPVATLIEPPAAPTAPSVPSPGAATRDGAPRQRKSSRAVGAR